MSSGDQPTLTLEGIRVRLRRNLVLDGVSLRLTPGMTAVVGVNGAGKTSLLKVLLGQYQPDQGTVRGVGHDRPGLVGYCPQDFDLPPNIRVGNFLAYAGWLKGLAPSDAQAAADWALRRVALADRKGDRVGELSGGMRRRVAIAQALMAEPDVVILDEPTSGLDPNQRIKVRKVLRDLPNTTTAVMTTQLVEDAVLAARRVVVLKHGRVIHDFTDGEASVAGLEEILGRESDE